MDKHSLHPLFDIEVIFFKKPRVYPYHNAPCLKNTPIQSLQSPKNVFPWRLQTARAPVCRLWCRACAPHPPWPSSHGVCMERCDPRCCPRDRVLPGGQGRGCQGQVPGGYLLNNASGLGVGAGRRTTLKCSRNICSLRF